MLDAKLVLDSPAAVDTPALATWICSSGAKPPSPQLVDVLAELDPLTNGLLKQLADAGELTGKAGESLLLHNPAGLKARRLLLLGAGKAEKFSDADVRKMAGWAARFLKERGITEFTFLVRPQMQAGSSADQVQAAVEGAVLANFEPGAYQTERANRKQVKSLQVAGPARAEEVACQKALQRGLALGSAQNLARELVNEPSNRLTPRGFAERAAASAREAGLGVEVLDENRIRELKMGAFLSVAQGSEEPPRLLVLTYAPSAWRPGRPVLGLVGKGVTFDSGGISLKPGEGMEKMKYDMAGGAAVVGAMRAIADLKPAAKVIAVVPLTENLPSGRAQKPGDVQIAMSGKSIEVVNTDAEGRLILADALHYARQLGATHLIDAATLTGAILVALGHVNVGAFTNNQKFLEGFLASGKAAGEKYWPMPLDDEYSDNIKSAVADIQNVGKGRGAGATNGALFLQEFVGDTPWIHLDIAGTAWLEEGKPWMAKGPTGIGVRTLTHFAENFSE